MNIICRRIIFARTIDRLLTVLDYGLAQHALVEMSSRQLNLCMAKGGKVLRRFATGRNNVDNTLIRKPFSKSLHGTRLICVCRHKEGDVVEIITCIFEKGER